MRKWPLCVDGKESPVASSSLLVLYSPLVTGNSCIYVHFSDLSAPLVRGII